MKRCKIYGLALALSLASAATAHAGTDVGKPARDYTVTLMDSQKVSSAQLKGKVVILNYWATWCGPCKAEMVVFENYLRTHPGSDLKVYAVATENEVPIAKLKPLQAVLSFPIARWLSGRGYGVKEGVPTSYVIDREGVLRYAAAGAFNDKSFAQLVDPLLGERAPAPATTVAAK